VDTLEEENRNIRKKLVVKNDQFEALEKEYTKM